MSNDNNLLNSCFEHALRAVTNLVNTTYMLISCMCIYRCRCACPRFAFGGLAALRRARARGGADGPERALLSPEA